MVIYPKYKWEHEGEYKRVQKEQEKLADKRFEEKYKQIKDKEVKYKNDIKDRVYIEGREV